jgi:phosphonate transport system substrate-binding protein
MLRKTKFLSLMVVVATFLAACSPANNLEPIRVAGIPLDDAQNVEESYQIFMELVSEATGREVEFYQSPDYASATEALIAGQVDIAQLSAFSYVLATARTSNLEILGVSTRNPEEEPGYYSFGIKRAGDTSITSLADLKNKKVCFSDPTSGAGYLWPAKFLLEAGLEPDPVTTQDFVPVFAESFPQVATSVSLGDCDAGFILDVFFDTTLKTSDLVDLTTLEKFWTSTISPGIPLVANTARLSTEELQKISQMVTEKANKDYLVEAGVCSDKTDCSFLTAAAWGYVPRDDSFFDELRDLCNLLKLEQCTP